MKEPNRNIENRLVGEISPLVEFLGAERVADLKDKVCAMILAQIQEDLKESSQYCLIYSEDLKEIADEALAEVRNKVKKMYKDKYLELAEASLKGVQSSD